MECTLAANSMGPEEHLAPPGPARGAVADARAPRTVFVVLTRSDELLEQLGQVLDGTGEVRHAENEEEARQFADPRHAAVMLLDAREHVEPGLVVERLHSGDGTTVIVVFAPADAAPEVAKAIKGSAAFAVLPIPVEPEKTRAVLLGAGEEALARRSLVTPVLETAPVRPVARARAPEPARAPEAPALVVTPVARRPDPEPLEPDAPPAADGGSRRSSGVPRIAAAALLGLLVIAAGAWLYLREDPVVRDARPPTPDAPAVARVPAAAGESVPAVEPPPEASLSTEPKEQLLDRARAAFHERRYAEPKGDNALHYYRSVLAQDPQDGEAREGLERVGGVLEGRVESALAANRFDDAARALEQLRLIRPGDPALDATVAQLAEQRIGAALARGDVEQAGELMRAADRAGIAPQRLAPLREQLGRLDGAQRAERLSRLVSARIREGQLLSPAGDSAKHHLEQLLKLPNGQRLGAAATDQLARALADRAQRAASQGQGAEAQQLLAEARALGYVPERPAAPPVVQPAPLPAAPAAATPPRPTEAAAARPDTVAASSARLSTPEPAARASSAGAAPGTTPAPASFSAADFKRTRYVAPVYPAQALSRGQSGEVRVRLTVDGSGRVSDVQVLSAAPAGVFDQAATNAVRKWRFEPIVRNGRAVEASVTTTISFRPDDASQR